MMKKNKHKVYNDEFYVKRDMNTKYAASKIASIVYTYFDVDTVVDLGCGVGTWLNEFKKKGAGSVRGYDGNYVNSKYLVIDQDEFISWDLNKKIIDEQKYDLAISLEVAEHLFPSRAKSFVKDLCSLSDVVLFSAAIPMQSERGKNDHINERRLSYWIKLFRNEGYNILDVIRPQVWDDNKILCWYRENTVIFYKKSTVIPKHANEKELKHIYDIVHPELYESKINYYENILDEKPIKIYLWVKNKLNKYLCGKT